MTDRVYVAGHTGLVGSAIVRRLRAQGVEPIVRRREDTDLTDFARTSAFLDNKRPTHVYLAAAYVGGIKANNDRPIQFIEDNVDIAFNVIRCAARHHAMVLFLGSSCIYPRYAAQPMGEGALMTGPLEPTNSAYAMAKLAGLELLHAYGRQRGLPWVAAMPCNLYGPGDSYDPATSHVLPALLRRFDAAKRSELPEVVLWGTGAARREFLHADDCAAACVRLMALGEGVYNVGSGEELSIRELAWLVADVVGYRGAIRFGGEESDGTPRKLLDSTKMRATGWAPTIALRDGIARTYQERFA